MNICIAGLNCQAGYATVSKMARSPIRRAWLYTTFCIYLFFSILSLCFHDSKWSESVNLVDTQFYW